MKLFLDNCLACFGVQSQEQAQICAKVAPRNQVFARNSGLEYLGASSLEEFQNFSSENWLKGKFKELGVTEVVPFIGHPAVEQVCSELGVKYLSAPGKLSLEARSKFYLFQLCQELNIPTLETSLYKAGSQFGLEIAGYKKADISAGNVGNELLNPGTHCFDYDVVLQPNLQMVGSPSVQVGFRDGNWEIIAIVDQLIDDGYNGLIYPSQLREVQKNLMIMSAELLAEHFSREGMREGRFSIDFYLDSEGYLWAGDLNLRQGGVSEPARIIQTEQPAAMLVDQSVHLSEPPQYDRYVRELIPWQNGGHIGLIILGDSVEECKDRLRSLQSS